MASFTTDNGSSDSASASDGVLRSFPTRRSSDLAATVDAGSGIGFTVVLSNSGAGIATGLSVTDNLPAGSGVSWTIDAANKIGRASGRGRAHTQILAAAPNTIAGNTSIQADGVSSSTCGSCG